MIQSSGLESIAPTFVKMMGLPDNNKFEGKVLIK